MVLGLLSPSQEGATVEPAYAQASPGTVIGTFQINYRLNAAGCVPTGSPLDGNPYNCPSGIPPGPHFLNAQPGRYRVEALFFTPLGGGGAPHIWSGDASAGTRYALGASTATIDFDHTFGQIVLYAWDWIPSDNDPSVYTEVRLTQLSQPYAFSGFFAPVDNPPTLNQVTAGQSVPVKFSLGGDRGLDIFAAGSPQSQQINCNSTTLIDDVEQTVTAGGSSLSYDPSSGRYTYVWKTEKAWAGTCRELNVKLNDGTDHPARFKFK